MTAVLGGKKDLSVAETDPRVPICLLTRESGDLAAGLAAAGISCEAGPGFFDLDERSARLRVPSPGQLDEFLRRIAAV
jgi:histidinol-phosphate aminotransferase